MVGDLHATHETPRLAAELTCTFARSGAPVTLAIEMPRDEQAALEVYLASDGGEAARSALISRPFWQRGALALASVANFAMIERIRALRKAGAPVSLLAIDASSTDLTPPPVPTPEQEEGVRARAKEMNSEAFIPVLLNAAAATTVRDRVMAQLVGDALRSDPARRFVVLLGAVHTNRLKGVPYAGGNSVASLLAPEVESLTLSTSALGGAAWACLPGGSGFGPLPFPPSNEQRTARGAGVYLSGELQDYDGLENKGTTV
jgi:hypothetical protein